jgi:hypothetical protein
MWDEPNALIDLVGMLKREPKIVEAAAIAKREPTFKAACDKARQDNLSKMVYFALTIRKLLGESLSPGVGYVAAGGHLLALIDEFPDLMFSTLPNKPSPFGVN